MKGSRTEHMYLHAYIQWHQDNLTPPNRQFLNAQSQAEFRTHRLKMMVSFLHSDRNI